MSNWKVYVNNPTMDEPLNFEREREREGEESDKRHQMIKKMDGNNKWVNNLNVIFWLMPISSKFNQNVLFFFDGGKKLNLES